MYKKILNKINKTWQVAIVATLSFLLIASISTAVLMKFADVERKRDLANWQTRLGIVADSRVNAINEWVARQFSELTSLAQNTSLQLYTSEIQQQSKKKTTGEPFQVSYLRNLIIVTAERAGFLGQVGQALNANVRMVNPSGIAILDINKNVLVSTPSMPPLDGVLVGIINSLPKTGRYISNIYKGEAGKPSVVFSIPIFSVQGDDTAKNLTGYVVGLQEVESTLFSLLKQPGATERTSESVIVTEEGGIVKYLTETNDGSPALGKSVNASEDLDTYFAIKHPGEFARKNNYAFEDVLVTGRKITGTPWTFVYNISEDEALSESESHIKSVLLISIVTMFFLIAAVIAAWEYTSALKQSKAADKYKKMMLDLEAQRNILSLISDNRPDPTFIVDGKNRYHFANLKSAEEAGIPAKDMIGRTIISIVGKDRAMPYIKLNATALADKKPVTETRKVIIHGQEKIVQSCHIPLDHLPYFDDNKSRDGVLVIEQDITAPIKAQEKIVRTFNALVDTLVSFMDKRDRHTADHSARVARLSSSIAREVGLDNVMLDTIETAGKLMNLGRMLIPAALLKKVDGLTKQEKKAFEDAINVSADLLKDIDFSGPVVDTIRQVYERVDGKGPMKLKGEKILITARIVAVANAFISMRSPRSYRLMKTLDQTLNLIQNDAGSRFDRKVVAALVNYIENRGGREELQNPDEIPPLWVSSDVG